MENLYVTTNSNENDYKNKKISLSFKSTDREQKLYKFLIKEIKGEMGISTYLKDLIEKDMKERNYNPPRVKKVKKRKVKNNTEKDNLINTNSDNHDN